MTDVHPLLAVIGAALVLAVAYDGARTTLSASGSGPLTKRLTSTVWVVLLRYHRFRQHHRLLGSAGTWITLLLIAFWVFMTALGFFLLFCSAPQAVVNSTTMASATVIERAYFIGYTLTTLGYGDFVPGSGPWQLLATVAAGNGLLLFTLSITYAIPIISAATEKRQLAATINAMGESPRAIIETTAGDGDFANLRDQLQQIQQPIAGTGQKHLAYPILHYFHSSETMTALPLGLVRLDLALTIILFGVPELPAGTRAQLITTQRVVNEFLSTLESAFIRPADETPRIPNLDNYAELPGIRKTATAIHAHLSAQQKQKLFYAYVEDDGWDWGEVWRTAMQR